jgi:hypothetical protein
VLIQNRLHRDTTQLQKNDPTGFSFIFYPHCSGCVGESFRYASQQSSAASSKLFPELSSFSTPKFEKESSQILNDKPSIFSILCFRCSHRFDASLEQDPVCQTAAISNEINKNEKQHFSCATV